MRKTSLTGNYLAELCQIDVTARNDRDDWSLAGSAGKCCRKGQSTCSFRDNAHFVRHEAHRLFRLVDRYNDIAIDQGFHSLPHAREHALTTRAVDERGLPIFEDLW